MKKKYFMILVAIFLVSNIVFAEKIFDITDPVNDDKAWGDVVYPEYRSYKAGSFDIERFVVEKENKKFNFTIEFREKIEYMNYSPYKYDYDLPDNFLLQLIHIYIDRDGIVNSGFVNALPGVNVDFFTESAWDKAIVITKIPERYAIELNRKAKDMSKSVIFPDKIKLKNKKQDIQFSINEAELQGFDENSGISVMVLGHDFTGSFKKNVFVKEIKSIQTEWDFGSYSLDKNKSIAGVEMNIGLNFNGNNNPNIIDIILPESTNQIDILKSFMGKEDYIKVPMYYSGKVREKQELIFSGKIVDISENEIIIEVGENNLLKIGDDIKIDNIICKVVKKYTTMIVAKIEKSTNEVKFEKNNSVLIRLN